MYYEIIKALQPHIPTLIEKFFDELLFAYNLHGKQMEEVGGNDDAKIRYIFRFSDKEDVREALSYMSMEKLYAIVKTSDKLNFAFDINGNILTSERIDNILTDNFGYYMFETLEKPWINEKTQRLYTAVWNIINGVNNWYND